MLRKRDGLSDIGPADSGKSKPDYPMSPRFDTDDPFDEFSPLATGRLSSNLVLSSFDSISFFRSSASMFED